MNLISCDKCGVVLDRAKLIFPDTYDHDSGEVIEENTVWYDDDYVSFIPCPICNEPIRERD